jgi:catechol 2,3-dioxygenase-like lactoylglutathione lyase family enzyme
MLGYATVGTNDFDRAKVFFDDVFSLIGLKRVIDMDRVCYWGTDFLEAAIGVVKPFDGGPANVGNGGMLALKAGGRAAVDAVHARALALGGRDEGAPGVRGPDGEGAYYGAYFRDLDGNKFVVFAIGGPAVPF